MKSRNLVNILLIAALFLSAAAPALAQTEDRPGARPKLKAEVNTSVAPKERRLSATTSATVKAGVRATSTATSTDKAARREAFQKEIAKKKAEKTARVMAATVERLEKLLTRIESRIAKIKAEGGVTVEAEVAIAAAKADILKAKAEIAAFATLELSGDNAQENFERVRTVAKEVKEIIKSVHTNLTKAVRSLNLSAKSKVDAAATSTATTTAQ